jgi:hypothetical protein
MRESPEEQMERLDRIEEAYIGQKRVLEERLGLEGSHYSVGRLRLLEEYARDARTDGVVSYIRPDAPPFREPDGTACNFSAEDEVIPFDTVNSSALIAMWEWLLDEAVDVDLLTLGRALTYYFEVQANQ